VEKKVNSMYTDPARISADIPGRVDGNPVFIYHDAFNSNKKEVEELKERYVRGAIGDTEVKEKLAYAINAVLEPMRGRRTQLEREPGRVDEIIVDGTAKVRAIVRETLSEMKKGMGFASVHNRLRRKAEDRKKKNTKAQTE